MLEAFVYDPLINWRLLARLSPEETGGRSRANTTDSGGGSSAGPSSAAAGAPPLRSRSVSVDAHPVARSSRPVSIDASVGGALQPAPSLEAYPRAGGEQNGGGGGGNGGGGEHEPPHPASLLASATSAAERRGGGTPVSCSVVSVSRRLSSIYAEPNLQEHDGALNARALSVLRRVKSKLAGSDFPDQPGRLDVATQVNRLVMEAQANTNLCQLFMGWCPFW